MAYASTLETTLCTAASRAIREALSIEEPIGDQQVRVYFDNRFIDSSAVARGGAGGARAPAQFFFPKK